MKLLDRFKIGTRIFIGFGCLVVFIGLVAGVGYYVSESVGASLGNIFHVRLPGLNYLLQADRDLQQLLVAERSIIFTDPKSKTYKALLKDYKDNLGQADRRVGKYAALADTKQERDLVEGYRKERKSWESISSQVLKSAAAGTTESREKAAKLSLGEANKRFEAMRDHLDKLEDLILKRAAKEAANSEATYAGGMLALLIVGGGGVLLGLLIAFFMGRGIANSLQRVIGGLEDAARQVTSASGEVDKSSQALAQGSSEQAASLEETSASMEEMSSMTSKNAQNAGQANQLMEEARRTVIDADNSMTELRDAMAQIVAANDETAKIIKTIDEIAFQTNLLALNAAVEAARAGEAGAGFAVVADEVRNLAMRAAEAAKNTSGLIESNISDINRGAELAKLTGEAFGNVREAANKVGELVAEIAAASGEQATGIEQVNRAMTEMDQVTQRNAAGAEEGAAAAAELSAQAELTRQYLDDLVRLAGKSGGKGRLSTAGGSGDKLLLAEPEL